MWEVLIINVRLAMSGFMAVSGESCTVMSILLSGIPLRKLQDDCIIEMRRSGDVTLFPRVAINDRISQCDRSMAETLVLLGSAKSRA